MNPMCTEGTPVQHYPEMGLYVKREDLCCPPGPHFSKTRGVYAHIKARPEKVIGCLDTSHSQGGWATAQACRLLGKQAVVYYPETVKMRAAGQGPHPQQLEAQKLGARVVPLQAGRSAVLYHSAKKHLASIEMATIAKKGPPLSQRGDEPTYMMPNALKLPEMITETSAEVRRTLLPPVETVIVSASSGTIAGGVWRGLWDLGWEGRLIVHQGYSRPEKVVRRYMEHMGWDGQQFLGGTTKRKIELVFVDEGYAYGDEANKSLPVLPFPSNKFYDRKAVEWWLTDGRRQYKDDALLWNIG